MLSPDEIPTIDAIAEIDRDKIKIQPLLSQLVSAHTAHGLTMLTITTREVSVNDIFVDQDKKDAYIVWVSKKDIANAKEKLCKANS